MVRAGDKCQGTAIISYSLVINIAEPNATEVHRNFNRI